jgi:hypothetical protein
MNSARRILCVAMFSTTVDFSAVDCLAQFPIAQLAPAENQAVGAAATRGDEQSMLTADRAGDERSCDLCRCIDESASPSVSKIEQALQSPLRSAGLDFVEQPLEEVVNFLQDDYGIAIQLDLPALKEAGVGPEVAVTVNLHKITLRSGLRLMLEKLGLTFVIRDEVLMITSPEEAETQLVTCVYDARNLVDNTGHKAFDELIDTIVSCIATETWAENGGGHADIRIVKPGLIVISQTQPVQDKIRGLLLEIREMRADSPAPSESAASAEPGHHEPLVTRSYLLRLKRTDKFENLGSELRDLIVQSMPDERWAGRLDDGRAVVLKVLPDRIVVRHKESVQDEVEELLTDSGVAVAAGPGMTGVGGGGGIFHVEPAVDTPLTKQ